MLYRTIPLLFFSALTLNSCGPSIQTQEAIALNNKAISFDAHNLDSAIYYYDKAIQTDSSYLLAYQNKINVLINAMRYQSALETLDHLEKKIQNAEIYSMRGILYDLTLDSISAQKNYRLAIDHIENETKRINDFAKYKKLYKKGTIYLLTGETEKGIQLIQEYSPKAGIVPTKKDSLLTHINNKTQLLHILLKL